MHHIMSCHVTSCHIFCDPNILHVTSNAAHSIIFCTLYHHAFRYVYFFEKKNPAIKVVYLSGLLALINEQVEGEEGKEGQGGVVEAHYRNTLGMLMFIRLTAEVHYTVMLCPS